MNFLSLITDLLEYVSVLIGLIVWFIILVLILMFLVAIGRAVYRLIKNIWNGVLVSSWVPPDLSQSIDALVKATSSPEIDLHKVLSRDDWIWRPAFTSFRSPLENIRATFEEYEAARRAWLIATYESAENEDLYSELLALKSRLADVYMPWLNEGKPRFVRFYLLFESIGLGWLVGRLRWHGWKYKEWNNLWYWVVSWEYSEWRSHLRDRYEEIKDAEIEEKTESAYSGTSPLSEWRLLAEVRREQVALDNAFERWYERSERTYFEPFRRWLPLRGHWMSDNEIRRLN